MCLGELMYVAAARALACAGMDGKQLDLIVAGTTSYDDQVPNVASGIQRRVGADGCAAMDVNTACTSFLYSLLPPRRMIRTGVVKNALVIGAEVISPFIDWSDRNTAVLFGDGGAAVVLRRRTARKACWPSGSAVTASGAKSCACMAWARYAHQNRIIGKTEWQFEGQEIFKKAVHGMAMACDEALTKTARARPTWTSSFPTRPICASSRPWPRGPACRWTGCSSTSIATATCPRPQCPWRCARRWRKAA